MAGTLTQLRELAGVGLRAGRGYTLRSLEEISSEEREALGAAADDPAAVALLLPSEGSGLTVKLLDSRTAELFRSLESSVSRSELAEGPQAIQVARLIADGVLEIETSDGFVGGPASLPFLLDPVPDPDAMSGRAARLAVAAVRYGASLGKLPAPLLAMRLYHFHRLPESRGWRRRLPDDEAVDAYLGISEGETGRLLESTWIPIARDEPNPYWRIWRHRNPPPVRRRRRATWKLYVSPLLTDLPSLLPTVVRVLGELQVPNFKIGRGLGGLLRPDKIVSYYWSKEHAERTLRRLAAEFEGVAAHGVPFAAVPSGNGLISLGVDPPREEHVAPWLEGASYRLWVCRFLAAALRPCAARGMPVDDAARFALSRLHLEGVDVESWTPDPERLDFLDD